MRIGLDVMGGDHAPHAILDGAFAALDQLDDSDSLLLVGDEAVINAALRDHGIDDPRIRVVPTSQVVGMNEPPVEAVRLKPDSSITVLAELASARKAAKHGTEPIDAILSAGNTGACVSAAQMHMRRLRNVHRPGIAVPIPTFAGPIVLIDVGANIEPKPHHLAQYGVMGDLYARRILGIERPRVALMNVGGEEQKGTAEMKLARDLLRSARGVNFIGYIEGRAVFEGQADVIITDGVVGNVMLKLVEGLSAGIFRVIAREVSQVDPDLARRFEPIVKRIYAQHDYHEYGGAPLLGVRGICLIGHGSSEARTITNAVLGARRLVQCGINDAIVERLGAMEEALT
jgi:glycerol-3-phosphate acyltransferase PlsX